MDTDKYRWFRPCLPYLWSSVSICGPFSLATLPGARLLVAAIVLSAAPAFAQRAPEAGYMFPPGGRAGTTFEVRLGGYDWTSDMEYVVHDPRIEFRPLGPPGELLIPPPPYWFGPKGKIAALPLPREALVRVTIPADVPPGVVYWQAANANGGTATGVMIVGDGPEVVEDERRPGPKALAELPVTVSGRISKIEEVDDYRFVAPQTGPITCDLAARRLGANFHGVIEVRDAQGKLVADAVDSEGEDVALTFAAAAGAAYHVRVRDLDYAGDRSYVYRLTVTAGPRVLAAIPTVGKRGETREVEFVGIGVASGVPRMESVKRQVTFPAAADAAALRYFLETPFGIAPAFSIPLGELPEAVDPPRGRGEPGAKPTAMAAPGGVTGVLEHRRQNDRYAFVAKKGEVWSIALEARRFGSPLDVALAVVGPDGKELAQNDDLPGTTDAGLDFTAPADGTFTLVVSDRAGRSGNRDAVYRLELRQPSPDFHLAAQQRLNVLIGSKLDLAVKARRVGGFAGPIALTVAGLPAGVSVPAELLIPAGKSEVVIPLAVAADAVPRSGLVTVSGTAQVGAPSVTRVATSLAAGSLAPRMTGENETPRMLVTTAMKPRCKGRPVDQDTVRKVHRGATFPAEVLVERLEGFTGEIVLKMAARQSYQVQGITGHDVRVPPGVERAVFPCFMPEWLETTRTSRMAMIAVVEVPDAAGRPRQLVADMTGMITMSLEGALLKLSAMSRDLVARPGEPFEVALKVSRSSQIAESARLELKLSDDQAGLYSAEPVVMPYGQDEIRFRIVPAADGRLKGLQTLRIRATALQEGWLPAISEAQVPVEFPSATAAGASAGRTE